MKFCLEGGMSGGGATLDPPEGYSCCVVEITQEYATLILARMKALDELHAADDRAYEIYFWDNDAEWYATDYDAEELVEIGEASRTECDQSIVRQDEICWTTIPKHSDVYMVSDGIPRKTIEAIAAGKEVPA